MIDKKAELKRLLKRNITKGEFTSSSGIAINYYIDVKPVALHTDGVGLIADLLYEKMAYLSADCIGCIDGPGITPVLGVILNSIGNRFMNRGGFIVRKKSKKHGLENCIEGCDVKDGRVILLDDVITTGKTINNAIENIFMLGGNVVQVLTVVDRTINSPHDIIFNYSSLFTEHDLSDNEWGHRTEEKPSEIKYEVLYQKMDPDDNFNLKDYICHQRATSPDDAWEKVEEITGGQVMNVRLADTV